MKDTQSLRIEDSSNTKCVPVLRMDGWMDDDDETTTDDGKLLEAKY